MKKQIPSLNGLRATSIFIVIFHHLRAAGTFGAFKAPPLLSIFLDGNFGVNVFFVISGFLITTLLIGEEEEYGKVSLKNFYIRRIFRIFPAYYFVLLVYFILQLCSVLYFTRESWLSSIFYYKYFFTKVDAESAHFWSLSVEEHFYLIWPLLFILFKRFRVYTALGIILLVLLTRYLAYIDRVPFPIFKSWAFIFYRMDSIMIGCLFALYKVRISNWMGKFLRFKAAPVLLLILLALSAYPTDWNITYKLHLGFLLVPLAVGTPIGTVTNILIGILVLYSINNKNWWFSLLNTAAMNYIGKLSYSLYLWQQLFIMSDKLGVLNTFPLNIICTVIAALISYYLVERPFLKLKPKFESETPQKPQKKYMYATTKAK